MHAPQHELRRVGGFRAVRFPDGSTGYKDNYYKSSSADIRGSGSHYTVGVLHLVRRHAHRGDFSASFDRACLLDCLDQDGAQKGYRLAHVQGFYGDVEGQCGHIEMNVRGSGKWSDRLCTGYITDYDREQAYNLASGLQLTVAVIDDELYENLSSLHINGRRHKIQQPDWVPPGPNGDGDDLYLGRGSTDTAAEANVTDDGAAYDWFVAVFYHDDAMSEEEIFALRRNIEIAHDIPDVDYTGYGVVPDHIWSVKRAMLPGAGNGISNWTSDGATGGKIFSRVGSIDVVDIGAAQFTSR